MSGTKKILFISHDANRAGAQIFLLNIMKYFHQKNWDLHLILLQNGVLRKEFEEVSTVYDFPKRENFIESRKSKILGKLQLKKGGFQQAKAIFDKSISSQNFDFVYANTIACANEMPEIYPLFKAPLISHIHELELSINMYSTPENRKLFFEKSSTIIACSSAVADNLIYNEKVSQTKIKTVHSFVDNEAVIKRISATDKEAIKEKYNIPTNAFVVGGCGNAELRKGIDVFLLIASKVLAISNEPIVFLWVGMKKEGEFYFQIHSDIKKLGIEKNIQIIEPTPDAIELINCFDIFCLPSREDPFPLVMLEAALAKKTIIGMEKSGGAEEFIGEDAGVVCKYLSATQIASKILELYENEEVMKQLGENASQKVLEKYNFQNSIKKIENLLK